MCYVCARTRDSFLLNFIFLLNNAEKIHSIWRVFTIILILSSFSVFSFLIILGSAEIDTTGTATYIIDGDTFDISTGDRIRLADIDCPERGQPGSYEATEFLITLVYNRKIYLDIDDYYTTGPYGRLICVVYVDYNSTHYLNVNKALFVANLAHVSDYDNEFSPYRWTLLAPKLQTESLLRIIGFSLGAGFVATLIVYIMFRIIGKFLGYRMRGVLGKINLMRAHNFFELV